MKRVLLYNFNVKRVILCFISLITYHLSLSQSWQPLGAGTNDEVLGFAHFKGLLYVGGNFDSAGGKLSPYIATWDGSNWDTVGAGIRFCNVGGIIACTVDDSVLYVGGHFKVAGKDSAKSIAEWNGSNWDTVGCGVDTISGRNVSSITLYNEEIYSCGDFLTVGNGMHADNIARWNGIKWDSVGKGLYGSVAWCQIVYNGKLYVGGNFDSAGGITAQNIACWDGTKWDSVGRGLIGGVFALAIYNGKLYAGGNFTIVGGLQTTDINIACWDGIKWDTLGGGVNNTVLSLASYNDNLYAGGSFDSAGRKPAMQIAKWNGTSWSTVGAGLSADLSGYGVWALYACDSTLYAGGDFTKSGTTTVRSVASWRDNVILGTEELPIKNYELKIYPNPSNGKFTIQLPVASGQWSEVEVYNMLGEKIYSSELPQTPGGALKEIDLSNQPNGIYLYRVITEQGEQIATGKFVIEK